MSVGSLGASLGGAMTISGILESFPDLIAWRDSIYSDFFPQV